MAFVGRHGRAWSGRRGLGMVWQAVPGLGCSRSGVARQAWRPMRRQTGQDGARQARRVFGRASRVSARQARRSTTGAGVPGRPQARMARQAWLAGPGAYGRGRQAWQYAKARWLGSARQAWDLRSRHGKVGNKIGEAGKAGHAKARGSPGEVWQASPVRATAREGEPRARRGRQSSSRPGGARRQQTTAWQARQCGARHRSARVGKASKRFGRLGWSAVGGAAARQLQGAAGTARLGRSRRVKRAQGKLLAGEASVGLSALVLAEARRGTAGVSRSRRETAGLFQAGIPRFGRASLVGRGGARQARQVFGVQRLGTAGVARKVCV